MPFQATKNGLNEFQQLLIGSWTNQTLPNATSGEGSEANPLSYNVMPLPQDPPGFILKNFTYYETLQFNSASAVALPAGAPNRGETTLQVPTALFYDQQVKFAEGPGTGQVVHVENGAWLNLQTAQKLTGPYPPPPGSAIVYDDPNQQPADLTIAKQMSVPHGNSILALGDFSAPATGAPAIPDAPSVLPTPAGLDVSTYSETLDQPDDYQNPQPAYTANTNLPLQTAVGLIKPTTYIAWGVSTDAQGHVFSIPFEEESANVTQYAASYWLLSTDGGETYPYLVYTQVIMMTFTIGGTKYNFPHATGNVVTKQKIS